MTWLPAIIALACAALGAALVAWHARRQDRRLLGVLLEQVRREGASAVPYRQDQRLRACQQRLTRIVGAKRANGRRWTRRLKRALEQP